GSGVTTLWSGSWSTGWTDFHPFQAPGDDRTFYIAYKEGAGDFTIGRIRRDGRGLDTLLQEKWTTHWTSLMTFDFHEKPHFLAYKSGTGHVAFGRLLPDHMLEVDDFEGTNPALNSLGGAVTTTSLSRLLFEGGVGPSSIAVPHSTQVLTGTT